MNRQSIIAKMRADANKDLMVVADGDKFVEALEAKVKILAQTLDEGLDINGIDKLLVELGNVNSISPAVKELQKSIDSLDISVPESVKIEGLESLLKAVRSINKAQVNVDLKPLEEVSKSLELLTKAVNDSKVPEQSQKASDYLPFRRVILIGKTLVFDDSNWGGSSGGGAGVAPPSMYYQPIVQSGAATTNIVGGVAGKRIKVTNYVVVLGGAGTLKFQGGSNDITGAMSFGANGGVSVGGTEFSPAFQTGVGEALNMVTTGAAGNGHIAYFFE